MDFELSNEASLAAMTRWLGNNNPIMLYCLSHHHITKKKSAFSFADPPLTPRHRSDFFVFVALVGARTKINQIIIFGLNFLFLFLNNFQKDRFFNLQISLSLLVRNPIMMLSQYQQMPKYELHNIIWYGTVWYRIIL